MPDISSLASVQDTVKGSLGFLSLDIIVLIVITIIFFILSLKMNKKPLITSIVAFYPATLIYTNFPYFELASTWAQIGAYAVLFIAIYIIARRNISVRRHYTQRKEIFGSLLLSVVATILLLVLYYLVLPPLQSLYKFTYTFETFFTETIPFGMWLILPIIVLLMTNRHDGVS